MAKLKLQLDGVPETSLWTLYHRALEARRPDAVLRDPKAIELVERLEYPFHTRLGDGGWGMAQWQALRTLSFDGPVRDFLALHPRASVVSLGAGLETQSHRLDNAEARWLSVDLPAIAALRHQLLPDTSRMRSLACSALDLRWMDEVDRDEPALITAQGLLMYFEPDRARDLIARCARRFAHGAMLFDAIPRWFGALSQQGWLVISKGYSAPGMPWALDRAERRGLRGLDPNIVQVRELALPPGRGAFFGHVVPAIYRMPWLKHQMAMQTVWLGFGPGAVPAIRARESFG